MGRAGEDGSAASRRFSRPARPRARRGTTVRGVGEHGPKIPTNWLAVTGESAAAAAGPTRGAQSSVA